MLIWDLKQSMPKDAMSWAVVGKLQSSDQGDVQREVGGGDVEVMTLVVMMCRVRRWKMRRKMEDVCRRMLRSKDQKYI